jgi:pimeloyl-ACP methyl ester carboxylesterase
VHERLDEVACPVLVVRGTDDGGPATFAPLVAAGLPAGSLEEHPNLTHFGPLEAPTELGASVRSFAATL